MTDIKKDAVTRLCDEYLEWRLQDMPELATLYGLHKYNDKLNDLSESHFEEQYEKVLRFLSQVDELRGRLPEDKHLVRDYFALKYELEAFERGFKLKGFYMPVCSLMGPHTTLPYVLDAMPFITREDFERMISRLRGIPTQIHQIIQLMKRGMETGIVQNEVAMKRIPQVLEKFIDVRNPESHPLYKYFNGVNASQLESEELHRFQSRATEILVEEVAPAFEQLKSFIQKEYVVRNSLGVSSLPNGEEFYKELIRFHASSELTPNEIQQIGYSEVKRIWNEIAKVAGKFPAYKDFPLHDFVEAVKSDTANFYHKPEEMLQDFKHIQCVLVMEKLPQLFEFKTPCQIIIEGDNSPDGPYAYHIPISIEDGRPGKLIVKTHNIHTFPRYISKTLSLHEGIPGHDLQGDFKMRSKRIHPFRKLNSDCFLNYSPSTFPVYMFYNEGWALYAESLGFDMNLFTDPLDKFGYYGEEMLRACRLVVDTGIHAFGWTKEQAMDFMCKNCVAHKSLLENEVDRYIMWPGQALSYKMGQLKIKEMRSKAEEKLESHFCIRQFHSLILTSFGSFEALERDINEWIARQHVDCAS